MEFIVKKLLLAMLLLSSCWSSVNSWTFTGRKDDLSLSSKAKELFDTYWNWKIADSPQFATSVGFHYYDDLLNDMSLDSFSSRLDKCHEFLDMVNELEPSLVNEADIVNMKVLRYELEIYIGFYDLKGFYQPVNYREGPHVDMEKLFGWMLLNNSQDYDIMIKRMQKIPRQMDQIIDLMRAGVEHNITYHTLSMKNISAPIRRFIVDDPKECPLYRFFKDGFPKSFTQDEIEKIQETAQQVIIKMVIPAYEKLLDYISNEYKTREEIAMTSLPNGDHFYKSLIWFHTSTNHTAEDIHNIGLKEMKKIERKLLEVIKEVGQEGMQVQDFSNMIRNDEKNYYSTSDELIAAFANIIHNKIRPHLHDIFNNIPKTKLGVAADVTQGGTGAYYEHGTYDGSRPGVFYIRTYYPESIPKFRMLSLSLHEGNPGHHLQMSHNIESHYFPSFRKVLESGQYGMAPSIFPRYTYYIEGWALYSEELGFDMGIFRDPLERYGHFNEDMYRAVRLVVDTGIHALNWTREEAVEFMFNHTTMPKIGVEGEIDRYITWPGQALAYKMGQLKFKELRSEAEEKLGKLFDLQSFHEVILNSFGPMEVVEGEVKKWMTF